MGSKKNNLRIWFRYGVIIGFIFGLVILKIILNNSE